MSDPFLDAATEILETVLGEMRQAIDGLDADALNWRPAGDDTNSIAVLVTHALHSTRSWLSISVGAPLPERDRPAEFRAQASPEDLRAFFDDFGKQCQALVAGTAVPIDWSAMRQTHARARSGAPEEQSAAWALVHALEHLREHSGQIGLTRQVWEQRAR